MRHTLLASVISAAVALTACDSKPPPPTPAQPGPAKAQPAPPATAPASATADDHDHHGHGPSIELGTTTVAGMTVKAARDAGALKPGGDAAVDVWINGGLGGAAAVRFWLGTEDAKGSIKAKAAVEAGKWHTHAEVPDPLPEGSRLWVEIEGQDGTKSLASFALQ